MDMLAYLKGEMARRGWNVARLAEAVGVNHGLAYKWVMENPRYRTTPGPGSCQKIADALGVDVDYVLELAGHRRARSEPEADAADATDPELALRMRQLEARLAAYPRAFWSSVLAANDRMLEAGDALSAPEPATSISSPPRTRISRPVPTVKAPRRGPGGDINAYSRLPVLT